jgi:conjugative relaxase-like TrwC/TraI family protein
LPDLDPGEHDAILPSSGDRADADDPRHDRRAGLFGPATSSTENYYAEGERVIGRWQGRGAELLGLSGDVNSEQFEAIRQSIDPQTGEFLRQRQSADRVAADGTTQSHGRNLYDFTISAPKSVSIMAQLAGDSRLIEAHQKAVGEALQELESYAATRVRQDGANEDRTTGNLVIAVYHHDTSRELRPPTPHPRNFPPQSTRESHS